MKLYFDVTTAAETQGLPPHGTTRVERGIVAALAEMHRGDLGFFRYQRGSGRFSPVDRAAAREMATAPQHFDPGRGVGPALRDHRLLRHGRSIEGWVRANVRAPLRRWRTAHASYGATPFSPDATVVFLGELQRHDFASLAALKRERRLRFVFLLYDLLVTLPDTDPRLADPSAHDLPSTDFMLREADLILSISRFSAGELARLMERRGLTHPPVKVIRLAGRVPGSPGTSSVLEGLRSGGFCLVVGDVTERKNHVLLFRLWHRMIKAGIEPLPIVVAGRIGSEMRAFVRDAMADAALARLVRFMPNADDDVLGWLYANCRFTLFPSLNEGFGLPVAESLAAGKVAVASSAAAIPEAGQGFAISIDPHDEDTWFSTVAHLMRGDKELDRIETGIRAGFRIVSWRDTASDVLAAIGETFGRGE